MHLEGIKIRLRSAYIRLTAKRRQKQIKNTSFTIISNNCWGGLVYESYDLEKQSPTVGMYFLAEEYIKFVSDLPYYLQECEITFVKPEEARHKDFYKRDKHFGEYPIARIGDIEIAMLHYHSEKEAKEKWERRVRRVCWNKLIVKMNDQNGCTEAHAKAFGELPYTQKIFFTVKEYDAGHCTVKIPGFREQGISASQEPFGCSKYLNVNRWINGL